DSHSREKFVVLKNPSVPCTPRIQTNRKLQPEDERYQPTRLDLVLVPYPTAKYLAQRLHNQTQAEFEGFAAVFQAEVGEVGDELNKEVCLQIDPSKDQELLRP